MNERIRELFDKAQGSIDPMDEPANVFEKFAELIVRECANFIAETATIETLLGDRLKEHFGVEE